MWNGQIYSKYAIVIMCLILFQNAKENNVSEYESKLIVCGGLSEVNLDGMKNNRCIIYFVDFSEPYLVLQKDKELFAFRKQSRSHSIRGNQ